MDWRTLFWLFLIERPHQWLSILRPERDRADRPAAARFVRMAFAVGVLEALALYVTSPTVLWTVVFWTQAVHVAWRQAAWARSKGRAAAFVAGGLGLGVAFAAARCAGVDVWTWFGAPGALAAGGPGDSASLERLLLFWILLHALPETVLRLRGVGLLRGAAYFAAAALLAFSEWWLVAATIGFPGKLLFPDLANVVNLGPDEGLYVVPFWAAAHFAHVAADFRRGLRPGTTA